jgi:hypothetical protein
MAGRRPGHAALRPDHLAEMLGTMCKMALTVAGYKPRRQLFDRSGHAREKAVANWAK